MKKRKNILTYISLLALSVCLLVSGVYAAKNATMTATSTVSFTASNCKMAITAITCEGQLASSTINAVPSGGVVLESKGSTTSKSYDLGSLLFDDITSNGDSVNPITISITVKNNSDWAIKLTSTASMTSTTYATIAISQGASVASLAAGSTTVVKATLTCKSTASAFTGQSFTISIAGVKVG